MKLLLRNQRNIRVGKGVVAYFVPIVNDVLQQVGTKVAPRSDDKKGGGGVVLFEHIQNLGCPLRVGAIVNFVLESVLAFERMLIRGGVRFPAGGSRLLLAQRIL